jgi:hypothetical protein
LRELSWRHGEGQRSTRDRDAQADTRSDSVRETFPSERVRRIIDGRDVASHGDREMPVWGDTFKRASKDASEDAASARIAALVRYLQSIQERPAE